MSDNSDFKQAQAAVTEWMTGRGAIGVWVSLGILAVGLIWFIVTGLLA